MIEQDPQASQMGLNEPDPSLLAPNPSGLDLKEKVETMIGFFNSEFDLGINEHGDLSSEPTSEQLDALRDWHEDTTDDGNIMPDMDTFTAKAVLARALMPQVNEQGEIQYLFGRGAGIELSVQGQVAGRHKRTDDVPYRSHSDFEIYGVEADNYDYIDHSDRFRAVFGGQEIYPVGKTKGLADLPETCLHDTAETVNFGGIEFLVPSLELQFTEKVKSANESKETELRGITDAEVLAQTYDIEGDMVHAAIDDFVVTPAENRLSPPEQEATDLSTIIRRKLNDAKQKAMADNPAADIAALTEVLANDFPLQQFAINKGIPNLDELIDSDTLELLPDTESRLREIIIGVQSSQIQELRTLHVKADEILESSQSEYTEHPEHWSYRSYFVDPETTAMYREADGFPPVDPDDYRKWLANLDPNELRELEEERQYRHGQEKLLETVHERLVGEVPELYEARLPDNLAERMGDMDYALGFNQSSATTIEEATEYLKQHHGIDFTMYDLWHRFLIYDEDMPEDMLGQDNPRGIAGAIDAGYTQDPSIGRFVTAFPEAQQVATSEEPLYYRMGYSYGKLLPDDAINYDPDKSEEDRKSVSPKYIAGFIDNEGKFWTNNNFGLSEELNFS